MTEIEQELSIVVTKSQRNTPPPPPQEKMEWYLESFRKMKKSRCGKFHYNSYLMQFSIIDKSLKTQFQED